MDITPNIYRIESPFGEEALLDLPKQQFQTDWFGEELGSKAEFCIAATPDALLFLVVVENSPIFTNHPPGTFAENLWEKDVGELFISQAQGFPYQEWNVSPAGAWWSQRFSETRIPDPYFVPDKSTIARTAPCGNGWVSWMQIPYNEDLLSTSRIDVTMILTDSEGQRRFLSCRPEPDIAPDFHRPQAYQTPKIIHFS
ncbi:MAG: hypothetical protein AAGH89_05300 [Verrucomicrobiota bacterium]